MVEIPALGGGLGQGIVHLPWDAEAAAGGYLAHRQHGRQSSGTSLIEIRSGADRVSSVITDVPTFLDRVSESDVTFFDPGDVVDLLAAHGCSDQIGLYLRRLSGGLQSTGTVRADGAAILAMARRQLAGQASASNSAGADIVAALNRAEC